MGDFVTLKFQANEHPPLATLQLPLGPPASSTNCFTDQKQCTALYHSTLRKTPEERMSLTDVFLFFVIPLK
jgi:hypothetical protein